MISKANNNEGMKRNYALDFLKFIASVFIIFHHYQQMTGVPFSGGINYWNGSFYWGYMVELFFVLSGLFMIGYISRIKRGDIGFKKFYLRRLFRLLPLVLLSAIIYEIQLVIYKMVTNQSYYGISVNLFGIVTDALCIQAGGAFQNPCVNYPTWYLSVLMLCYASFYFNTYIAKRLKVSEIYFYIGMVLLGVAINTYSWNLPFLNNLTSRGYYSFFTGVLLGVFLKDHNGASRRVLITALMAIALFILGCLFIPEYLTDIPYILTFIVYPSIIVVLSTRTVRQAFNRPVFNILGIISFDMYIWHNPMFQPLFTCAYAFNLNIDYSNRLYMYIFLIVVIVVSFLSHYFIERPLNRRIEKIHIS